ncbi:hypothetical protein KIPB_012563, partial [Kipferlia bialata]|eukprot:g12563.t1
MAIVYGYIDEVCQDMAKEDREFDGSTIVSRVPLPFVTDPKKAHSVTRPLKAGDEGAEVVITIEPATVVKASPTCPTPELLENCLNRVFHLALALHSPYKRRGVKYMTEEIKVPGDARPHIRKAFDLARMWRGFTLSVALTEAGAVAVHE